MNEISLKKRMGDNDGATKNVEELDQAGCGIMDDWRLEALGTYVELQHTRLLQMPIQWEELPSYSSCFVIPALNFVGQSTRVEIHYVVRWDEG